MAHPRLSMNQGTIKRTDLATALRVTADAGMTAIGPWREPVQEVGQDVAARMIADSGLRVSTLCRAGFLTAIDPAARAAALADNRRAIDEAAAIGAPTLVMVGGGLPEGSRDLAGARARVADALGELAPYAVASGVTLAIEPLHPMYATDRCVVSTLGQALDIAHTAGDGVGVVVDTFHVFWDPTVLDAIARAGSRILSYQVCDWATPLPEDVLLGRHQPGDGVIDFAPLTAAVLAAGYAGDIEVEIFNGPIWERDPALVARQTVEAFDRVIAPLL